MSRMLSALQRIEAKSAGEEPASPKDGPRPQPADTKKPSSPAETAADAAEGDKKGASDPVTKKQASPAAVEKALAPEAKPTSRPRRPSEADRVPGSLEKVARLVELAQKGDRVPDSPEGQRPAVATAQAAAQAPHAPPESPPKKGPAPATGGTPSAAAPRPAAPPKAEPRHADAQKNSPPAPKPRPSKTVPPAKKTSDRADPSEKAGGQSHGGVAVETRPEGPAQAPGSHAGPRPAPMRLASHWHQLAETVLSEWAGRESVVLMFSSPEENESRTAAVVSLAAALAAAAPDEVLLVDANLCEPALAGRLGVAPDRALADVLNGTAAWQSALKPTCARGLTLLPGRAALTDTPVHLRALGPVIEDLRRRYRLVLIAATSIGYGETAAITRWCDGVYLWIRLNKTPCRTALEAINIIERHGGRVAGCVLAEVPGSE